MIAKELISDGILPLKPSDSGQVALEWMEDFRVSHLPVVDDTKLLGLISEWEIYSFDSLSDPIETFLHSLQRPFITEDQHIYDVMRLVHLQKLSLIPVLDLEQNYLGSITLQCLGEHLSHSLSAGDPGGIIILGMNTHDYMLSEVARIVEANDARILSMFVQTDPLSEKMRLTLKVNKREIRGLLQTFARFNYEVLVSYSDDNDNTDLKERYDALMSYLKV
ncbi:MAG: CBS domain-containing protein [Bacteroidales bacterium]|nr:CBS domain-containing protein [Bacteroidales bacterium]